MGMGFFWPASDGEWLAWSAALVTVLIGLFMLFAPRLALKALRLQTAPDHPEAVAQARATMAGFHLGTGIACLLLAQPLLYAALGFCWALAAFGRILSMASDRGGTLHNWSFLVAEVALAAAALVFVFGIVA